MNRLLFFALAAALVVTGCDDQPTSPPAGQRPSALIFDANHGGDNKNVFFLPPLVPNPSGSPFFKAGEFNPNLTSAVIRVCLMVGGVCDAVVASFGVGQATGPITISSDHYLAQWHTDESSPALVVGQAYRIEVFPDADVSNGPIAWADVAIVNTGKELKNLNSNETIGLIDGRTLPIKVRFQNGVRCESDNCKTQRVTNTGGTVVLQTGNGALLLQSGWLPPGVSEVTVTLQRHATGSSNDCVGNAAFTGPGLVAQREACLEVTTDPVLPPGPTTGIQRPAFIYVCTESGEEDPLHEFLQVIKADDGRPLQALRDVSHQELLALGFEPSCEGTLPPPIGLGWNPFLRLASRGLQTITRPLGQLLEVKPLYAIDLGQGGEISLFDGFSYFTLGAQAIAAPFGSTPETAPAGSIVSLSVQITSLNQHTPGETESGSLAGIDVTFTVTDGDGGLTDPDDDGEGDPETSLTVQTNSDGVATVDLHVATGTNVVEAVASVDEEPVAEAVTFTTEGLAIVNQTLIACTPEDRGGDQIDRGWYVPSFPGVTLHSVALELHSEGVAGAYTFDLTARRLSYDGTIVGTSRMSVALDGENTPVVTTFVFPDPVVPEGSLVTFSLTPVSGPASSVVFYNVPRVDDPSCPIVETNDTAPPLSTFRRQGIFATIVGGAGPPVIP